MKILLIQPYSSSPLMDQVYLFEPLALEYLGAGAKLDGHEVTLIDARIDHDIDGAIKRCTPDVVGITGFTSHVNIVKEIARRAKELAPAAKVIVGGHHATVRPEDFNVPAIDLVVIGEGVFTLREVLAALSEGRELLSIRGLAIPAPGGMTCTAPREYTLLDELPVPDRTLTAGYRGNYFSEWFKPLASIRTSLGCTARCNFCALWAITGGRYLRREAESVVAELATIAEENVFFCDDESMCDTKRMDRLADLIEQAGIRKNYFLYARVDTIVRHPDLFAKWARIGLSQVFVGMEDFSDVRLEAMKKGVTVAQQEEATKILDRIGVMMYASFMVDPDYGKEDFLALKQYVRKLKLKYATFTVKTPLPGTELHESVKDRLLSETPELYDMLHALVPTRLPLPEFYEEMAQLYAGAVPIYRSLPVLIKFGLHGMLLRIRLFGTFLKRVRQFHLEYS
ncbi:B12-binding domain-containing radical SAM protein [Geomesophilobacter sediminis]|uniref:Cobalamin-dependent protein n=1 Tax=Geomesophilobacter sediminis TaxID=2798584 RepID=A0A8J7IRJ6_9BACT|nr:radical SAM protein [Geomesophilobacter sediminis]MBJ6725554.1 cobalamin-dependent protein [Geomesophilobacter sediminis]